MMTSFFPLEKLHQIPGFAFARYESYAGGKGNSVRFTAMAPRDDALRVRGTKSAVPVKGRTACGTYGSSGDRCSCRVQRRPHVQRENLLTLPRSLATGEAITWVNQQTFRPGGADKVPSRVPSCWNIWNSEN